MEFASLLSLLPEPARTPADAPRGRARSESRGGESPDHVRERPAHKPRRHATDAPERDERRRADGVSGQPAGPVPEAQTSHQPLPETGAAAAAHEAEATAVPLPGLPAIAGPAAAPTLADGSGVTATPVAAEIAVAAEAASAGLAEGPAAAAGPVGAAPLAGLSPAPAPDAGAAASPSAPIVATPAAPGVPAEAQAPAPAATAVEGDAAGQEQPLPLADVAIAGPESSEPVAAAEPAPSGGASGPAPLDVALDEPLAGSPVGSQTGAGTQSGSGQQGAAGAEARADAADRPAGSPVPLAAPPRPLDADSVRAHRAAPLERAPRAVAQLLHVASQRGVTHARIALRPMELGGIEIRLQTSPAGVAAQVIADSPEAARMLQQAGDDLRRALARHDVDLLSLDVSTSSQQEDFAAGDRHADPHAPWAGGRDRRDPADAAADAPVAAQPLPTVIQLPDGLLVDVLA